IVTRRKGKEVMVESDTPKKKKLQEQIDAQVARELEEQQEREDMRMNEQIARDAKWQGSMQRKRFKLPLEKKIELISDLVKYQEHYTMVHKFQSQQRRLMSKKQKREYYMVVIKSNLGWRFKDFKEKEQVKKQKSSEEAPETETSTEEFTEDKIKEIMQLVPVKDIYVQALQVKHPIIDWKVHFR
nr:hypothetical protein [Tanacetum cinerariifolium]